jgi:hypothetical protein
VLFKRQHASTPMRVHDLHEMLYVSILLPLQSVDG